MNLVITNPAKSKLNKLYIYYKKEVSKKLAERIKSDLLKTISLLNTHPNIGQKERILGMKEYA